MQISFEKEVDNRIAVLKETVVAGNQGNAVDGAIDQQEEEEKESDQIFLGEPSESVDTVIKREAVNLRTSYHSLDANGKDIVSLEINSTLGLSFQYPAAQVNPFGRKERHELTYLDRVLYRYFVIYTIFSGLFSRPDDWSSSPLKKYPIA